MELDPRKWGKPTEEEMTEANQKKVAMEKIEQETTNLRNLGHTFEVNSDGTIREARSIGERIEDKENEDIK